jgi:hypothetical protein
VKIVYGGALQNEAFSRSSPSFLLSLHRRKEIPLEECVVDVGSSKGKFLCVVGGCGQNSDHNLRKRHVIVTNRCCMCKRSEETVDHLLLHCEVAFVLWSAIFGRFGMS